MDDVKDAFGNLRTQIDPSASPEAETLLGEAKRNFRIGLNQGELAFDVASTLYGGPLVKGAIKAGNLVKANRALPIPPRLVPYFDEIPNSSMGSHYITRRTRLPAALGGGPLPSFVLDSPFARVMPGGRNKGEFYRFHFENDPKYFGGRVRGARGRGSGWSGQDIGWQKHDQLGRTLYGSPTPLKLLVGGGLLGGGAAVDVLWPQEEP